MAFVKTNLSVLIFFIVSLTSFSQNPALNYIDTVDLKRHLSFISSDSLQGRSFGTPIPGLDIAAVYLKTNAEKIGLTTNTGDYFQNVPLISSQPDFENTFLKITNTTGNILFKTDSVIGLPSGTGINVSNLEVIFAGFGWLDEKTGYNDFQGIDLAGKVVLFATGSPESFQKNELQLWNNQQETSKVKRAFDAGATAPHIITVGPQVT